jgi:anti-sigma B factor antagonist
MSGSVAFAMTQAQRVAGFGQVSSATTRSGAEVATVALQGEIDQEDWAEISLWLESRWCCGIVKVVLDLSLVQHCDFRGLRHLAALAGRFREAGGDLKLSGVSPYLFQIFQATGQVEAFDFFEHAHRAGLAFGVAPAESPQKTKGQRHA